MVTTGRVVGKVTRGIDSGLKTSLQVVNGGVEIGSTHLGLIRVVSWDSLPPTPC